MVPATLSALPFRHATWLVALALVGCASTPSPAPSIAAGAASIEAARAADAGDLAATDINNARSKLERARMLAQAGDERGAIRQAEQADIDAQLARAKAGSEKSRRAVSEIEASLQSLREEMSRSATTSPVVRP